MGVGKPAYEYNLGKHALLDAVIFEKSLIPTRPMMKLYLQMLHNICAKKWAELCLPTVKILFLRILMYKIVFIYAIQMRK